MCLACLASRPRPASRAGPFTAAWCSRSSLSRWLMMSIDSTIVAARIAARPTNFDRVGRVDDYHLFAWVMGADYSIADISLLGWVRNLIGFYETRELVGFVGFLHVQAWLDRGLARPAVQRGLQVTAA
jgi:glutathione S-transferase